MSAARGWTEAVEGPLRQNAAGPVSTGTGAEAETVPNHLPPGAILCPGYARGNWWGKLSASFRCAEPGRLQSEASGARLSAARRAGFPGPANLTPLFDSGLHDQS